MFHMTSIRLMLKFKGKIPEMAKMAIKLAGGYWDDLFDAYSVSIDYSQVAAQILAICEGRVVLKQVVLENWYVNQPKRIRFMNNKYFILMQKLHQEEKKLLEDIEKWEKITKRETETGEIDLPYAFHMYEDPPDSRKANELGFFVELNLHKRTMECKRLREELKQINNELSILEKNPSIR